MSQWTHITACLSVETGIEEPKEKLIKQVKEYLKNAPKITGSEKDADVFVNIQSGYNVWIGADCAHCKYYHIRSKEEKYDDCFSPDDYKCKSANYQTCITISIQGDLRDRVVGATQEDFDQFLAYISEKWSIRDYAVNIEGE